MKENLKFASFLIVFFLIGGVIIVFSLFEFYYISGDSMAPTYEDGEYLFVNTREWQAYERGDVIIYQDGEVLSVKRVIGIGWETVKIGNGKVYVNDVVLGESYLTPWQKTCIPIDCTSNEIKTYVVEEGHYFVLGDNRAVSRDSRDCFGDILCSEDDFRAIPTEVIIGKITTTLPSWLSSLLINQSS